MNRNNKSSVEFVKTNSIFMNPFMNEMFSIPKNYDVIKNNIQQVGIINPIIVNSNNNTIVSGNVRHQIAMELGIPLIPVIFVSIDLDMQNLLSASSNNFRTITFGETIKMIEFFETQFPVIKGQRSDINEISKAIKEEREKCLKPISTNTRNMVKSIKRVCHELYGEDTKEFQKIVKKIDTEKISLNSAYKTLLERKKRRDNQTSVPDFYEYRTKNVKIINQSCANMKELEENSINSIITSPPYFQMRDYGTGKEQLGLEKEVNVFIDNLVSTFDEAHRVLKDDGSLFVNINDCVINGQYQAVPELFLLKMIKAGWRFNDKLLWLKNNSQFTPGNRSVRNFEPIFHFTKTHNFFYNDCWLQDFIDETNKISNGTKSIKAKLISAMDFRDGIYQSNCSNTLELKNKCKKQGFHLTHSATFPVDLPLICLLSTTKPGDTVLDMFNGTATTGEASLLTNRKYVGYELFPEFVMASEVRLEEYELEQVA